MNIMIWRAFIIHHGEVNYRKQSTEISGLFERPSIRYLRLQSILPAALGCLRRIMYVNAYMSRALDERTYTFKCPLPSLVSMNLLQIYCARQSVSNVISKKRPKTTLPEHVCYVQSRNTQRKYIMSTKLSKYIRASLKGARCKIQ